MIQSINHFQKLINDENISLTNTSLNKIINKFKCFLLKNKQDNKNEIKKVQNTSKIIIIDKKDETESYFIVIFDYTILFYVNPYLPDNFQHQICKYDKTILSESIECFSKKIIFKLNPNDRKEFSLIWKLVLPSFTSFLINKNCHKTRDIWLDNEQK